MSHKANTPHHIAPQLYRAITNKIWQGRILKKQGNGKVGQRKTEECFKKTTMVRPQSRALK